MMRAPLMLKRKLWKLCYGFRNLSPIYAIPLVIFLMWVSWKVSGVISEVLRPPEPPDNDIRHFRRSRSLRHYLDNMELLIEPSSLPCSNLEAVPVLVMVASSPSHWEQREAIRSTWGKHFPTYFILGLSGKKNDDSLIDNYVEAKQYGDMVVYDFKDHYQNLTLKTALMLKWCLNRCPQAQFLYKVDDDVLINPWVLKEVLSERRDALVLGKMIKNAVLFREETHKWYLPRWLEPDDVIPNYIEGPAYLINGYAHNDSWLHRDEYNKWYLPRWLCNEDLIPQYVTGPAYLFNGDITRSILETAMRVPIHNMEDVYFTYNVAKKTLGYELTHDVRLSTYRPRPNWLPIGCAYWTYASMHSMKPDEIRRIWSYLQNLGQKYSTGEQVCSFYNSYVKAFVPVW
ncbi:galactosyltransferase domain-containing protein [Phthorimaea operculella]|nr:galactosyltransferase domain-containing protein [Phthorimaea operculella]